MKQCKRCGLSLFDGQSTESSDALKPLEEFADLFGGTAAQEVLCRRCREEKRLTGAALVDGLFAD